MMEDRFLKRLRKKARKGLRGWPIATVAFYGPNLSQATKVTVGIVPSENADVKELRDWKVDRGDIRADPGIAQEILEFIEQHRVLSVAMTNSIIGCPHQEGIDYEGEWCPACEFWHGRDRFTGQTVNSILAARTDEVIAGPIIGTRVVMCMSLAIAGAGYNRFGGHYREERRETSPPKISTSGRERCRAAGTTGVGNGVAIPHVSKLQSGGPIAREVQAGLSGRRSAGSLIQSSDDRPEQFPDAGG